MLDVRSYLDRIGYSGSIAATAVNLRALHRAHLLAVPFENLDISLGRKIVVDEDAILRKIVELRRGGFCYELNSAFAALLRALGFQVTLLSARVARSDGGEGPEFDHLTLRVDLQESWLADVGFGDSFLEPLRLEAEAEQCGSGGHIPAGRRWRPLAYAKAGVRRELDGAVLVLAGAAPFRGVCGHVPLSSDVAGVVVHAETYLLASYCRGADYVIGDEADCDEQRQPSGDDDRV